MIRWPRCVAKALLRSAGFELVRTHLGYKAVLLPCAGEGLSVLDLAVHSKLASEKDFFFVQIGANDGVRADPLRPLVLKYHLRGLLVEPLPDMFVKLTENYATEAQLQFENAAIAKQNREASLFRFRIDAPIRDCDHGVATFNEEQIRRRARERRVSEEYVERVSVPCLTYDDLIAKHGIKSTTLLQIDTEGYDFEVLKMALSSRVLPDIINYEFVHLSLGDRLASCQLLAEHNYSLFHSSFDTLALHNAESEFTDAV